MKHCPSDMYNPRKQWLKMTGASVTGSTMNVTLSLDVLGNYCRVCFDEIRHTPVHGNLESCVSCFNAVHIHCATCGVCSECLAWPLQE